MSNHIHLIVQSKKGKLSDLIRDFKKFTATKILEKICKALLIELFVIEDHMLTGYDEIKKDDGGYYVKFTRAL